jgi:hypothetical protein
MEQKVCLDLSSSFAIARIHREATTVERVVSAPAAVCHGVGKMRMQRLRKYPPHQHRPSQNNRKAVRSRLNQLFAQGRLVRSILQPRDFCWQAMLADQRAPSTTNPPNNGPLSGPRSRCGYQAIPLPRKYSTAPCTLVLPGTLPLRCHLLYSLLRILVFEARRTLA